MSDQHVSLKQCLKRLIWKLHEIESTVCDFNGDHELLFERINKYVEELASLQSHSESVKDIEVPVELLRYMDEGGNPDTFTSDIFRRALRSNQQSMGKAQAFSQFRDAVEAQLQAQCPQDLAAYRADAPDDGADAAQEQQQ